MLKILLPATIFIGMMSGVAAHAQEAAPAPAAAPQDAAAQGAEIAAAAEAAIDPIIERGKYLAAAGNCISCHTRHGGEPFAGGLGFETKIGPLPATIYSTNITPDPETGIGKWTDADLIKAMHEGVAPGGRKLFPAFPYTSFTKVTDEDIKAIYAYLMTVTPVKYSAPRNSFAFSQRWAMSFWNALFFKPGRFQPVEGKSEEWNRGAYLVEGLGHCSACHSPRNLAMAEIASKAYAGGAILDHVGKRDENKIREWSAPNLTPVKGGLASWSVNDIANYLKKGFSATRAGSFGPMNEVITNSMRHMTAEDTKAMAVYIKELQPQQPTMAAISPEQTAAGEKIYADRCEDCHAKNGRGGIFKAPPLEGSAIAQAADPSSAINVVLYGANAPEAEMGAFGAWETMKPYGDILSDADVAAVLNYVRSSFGNVGGPVSAGEVAKQR